MRYYVSAIVFMALIVIAIWADDKKATKIEPIEVYKEKITNVLSHKNNKISADLSLTEEDDKTTAILSLIDEVKLISNNTINDTHKYDDREMAYRACWLLLINVLKESKDHGAQQNIINEWNLHLKDKDSLVPSQIFALSEKWDKRLLTEEFYNLLDQTTDNNVISAISFVLYMHGDDQDCVKLMNKRKSGIDLALQQIIQNSINWMKYRLGKDKTTPGPSSAPPKAPFPQLMAPNK